MKDYRILTILGVPYLTACAGLYHIAFWGTFNINGMAYLGLSDIIKSYISPFIYFFVITILDFIIIEGILRGSKILPHGGGRETHLGKKLNSKWGISISLLIWLTLVILLYYFGDVSRWLLWALFVGMVPVLIIDRFGLWLNRFNNDKLRIYEISIFVFIPILSFASGKY